MRQGRLRRFALAVGTPILAVGVITAVLHLVRTVVWVPNLTMTYLVAVLAIAITLGSRASIVASIASFVAFDFFFIEPLHTWTVADPEEWVSLATLLGAGIVTGQLAELARRRTVEAALGERDARVLFDVVRLVNELDLEDALRAAAERLQEALDVRAVWIKIGAVGGAPVAAGAGDAEALAFARSAETEGGRMLRRSESGHTRWVGVRRGILLRSLRSDRYQHFMVRIESEGRDLGWIVVVNERARSNFDQTDERLLLATGSQLGRAAERRQLQREATKAEVLRRTDELRSAMLNAVSHDLRTPLSSIVAAAESLQSDEVDWTPDEREEFAESIETEARRVDQMVSHLLDLSRIEAGALRVDAQWRDLGEVVADTVSRLRPLAHNHELIVDVHPDLPPLRFDAVAIGEVLTNLVENAIRYTPPGSQVTVATRALDTAVEVEVSDNGPGLSPEALAHLFEPFARGTRGRVHTQGSGLGLAVAKGLVEAHGGNIRAKNRPEGGASFRFTIPVDPEHERKHDAIKQEIG